MGINILHYFIYFCAGVFFHMSCVHFFCFAETASHPAIRIWKNRKTASAISGCVQLCAGLLILLLLRYRFELSLNTLLLFIGFSVWGLMRGMFLDKKDKIK